MFKFLRERMERQIKKALEPQLEATRDRLLNAQKENEALTAVVKSRNEELQRIQDDLLAEIRMLQGKASPESVWIDAFSEGFSKGWDERSSLQPHIAKQSYESGNADCIKSNRAFLERERSKIVSESNRGASLVMLKALRSRIHDQRIVVEREKHQDQTIALRAKEAVLDEIIESAS